MKPDEIKYFLEQSKNKSPRLGMVCVGKGNGLNKSSIDTFIKDVHLYQRDCVWDDFFFTGTEEIEFYYIKQSDWDNIFGKYVNGFIESLDDKCYPLPELPEGWHWENRGTNWNSNEKRVYYDCARTDSLNIVWCGSVKKEIEDNTPEVAMGHNLVYIEAVKDKKKEIEIMKNDNIVEQIKKAYLLVGKTIKNSHDGNIHKVKEYGVYVINIGRMPSGQVHTYAKNNNNICVYVEDSRGASPVEYAEEYVELTKVNGHPVTFHKGLFENYVKFEFTTISKSHIKDAIDFLNTEHDYSNCASESVKICGEEFTLEILKKLLEGLSLL